MCQKNQFMASSVLEVYRSMGTDGRSLQGIGLILRMARKLGLLSYDSCWSAHNYLIVHLYRSQSYPLPKFASPVKALAHANAKK